MCHGSSRGCRTCSGLHSMLSAVAAEVLCNCSAVQAQYRGHLRRGTVGLRSHMHAAGVPGFKPRGPQDCPKRQTASSKSLSCAHGVTGMLHSLTRTLMTGSKSTGHQTCLWGIKYIRMMSNLHYKRGRHRTRRPTDLTPQIARRHLCSGLYAAPPSPRPSFHAGR